jgi:hypothetical protein
MVPVENGKKLMPLNFRPPNPETTNTTMYFMV